MLKVAEMAAVIDAAHLKAAVHRRSRSTKAFCDLAESARIAKTRRNKELELKSGYA
jgi:hypothetical protein